MSEVGFVAGYLPFPDRLRVREALSLFAGFYGLSRKAGDAAVASGLERFGIGHLADRMCMELSSGQRTLVGIVKAVLPRPSLLVLDEPTASLDPDVAFRVRSGLLDVAANDGTALLVTSHNMLEVERLCERVVFLAGGQVVADGSPAEVADAFGHGDLEGVFLHLAGTVVAEDQLDRAGHPPRGGGALVTALELATPTDRPRSPGCASAPSSAVTPTCSGAARTAGSTSSSGRSSTCCCGVRSARSSPRRTTSAGPARPTCWPGSCSSTCCSRARSRCRPGFMEETWTRNLLNMMTTPAAGDRVRRGPRRRTAWPS